jgi:dTDP-4-dehydrorhamnose 3,5-epimerase
MDVIVDLRVGSPTFAQWEVVRLDDEDRTAVYLSEGLGHAFAALTDDATVIYLCSEVYNPTGEHGIHPLDPELGIDWAGFGVAEPLLSPKDLAAPTLAQAKDQGLLPDVRNCQEYRRRLVARAGDSETRKG